MVGVWLYAKDGRKLVYAAVQVPMPRQVVCGGSAYSWNAQTGRYEKDDMHYAASGDATLPEVMQAPQGLREPAKDELPGG
jgi:hypothetical protein